MNANVLSRAGARVVVAGLDMNANVLQRAGARVVSTERIAEHGGSVNFESCHRAQPVQVRLLPSLSSADHLPMTCRSTVASERAKTTRVIHTSGT